MREPAPEQWTELAQKYGLRLIVLFGSHAKGYAHERSDLDIAVLPGRRLGSFDEQSRLTLEIAAMLDISADAVDLVTLPRQSPTLLYQIAKYGRPLAEMEAGAWQEFREEARARWRADEPRRRTRDAELSAWMLEIASRGQKSSA